MAKCIISSCNSKGCDLFCAPEDKTKLKLWQTILKTEESEFLICSVHFDSKFIGRETFLTQNAFPSILISPEEEFDNLKTCQSCLKNFDSETKHATSVVIRRIFLKATGIRLKADGLVCDMCYQQLTDYDFFVSDLKMKHELLQKQALRENRKQRPGKRLQTIDPLDALELPSPSMSPDPQWDNFEENGDDDDVIVLPTEKPRVFEVFDDEEDESHQTENDGDFEDSENLVVAVDPDSMYDNNKDMFFNNSSFPAHFLDFAESSTPQKRVRDVSCRICYKVFPSIVGLKIHEKKMHKGNRSLPMLPFTGQSVPSLKVKEGFPTSKPSIQCTDCDGMFKSYYHMQKHRALEHSDSAPFKCHFPYCRTRGETVDEINEHYNKFHQGVEPPPAKKRKRRSKKNADELSD